MVKIELSQAQWVGGPADDAHDLCLHGRLLLEVDGAALVTPDDGEWTLTAAGLHLLRTMDSDSYEGQRVSLANWLIPCCGNAVYDVKDAPYEVTTLGCPVGIELDIRHEGGFVRIGPLRGDAGDRTIVVTSIQSWRSAVLRFCSQVTAYYNACEPKSFDVNGEAWPLLWAEWEARGAIAPRMK